MSLFSEWWGIPSLAARTLHRARIRWSLARTSSWESPPPGSPSSSPSPASLVPDRKSRPSISSLDDDGKPPIAFSRLSALAAIRSRDPSEKAVEGERSPEARASRTASRRPVAKPTSIPCPTPVVWPRVRPSWKPSKMPASRPSALPSSTIAASPAAPPTGTPTRSLSKPQSKGSMLLHAALSIVCLFCFSNKPPRCRLWIENTNGVCYSLPLSILFLSLSLSLSLSRYH
mmetsp:Transcript_27007/g.55890  ORF Transcript_27007/g.55890 Transcript_27007/m.55890 type:complete len:230 (-) Transcript_27007:119-808(-)